jgi:hypothetical protein
MPKKDYGFVSRMPVAKLYYKGSHSHPVRRTVLVIESNSKYIRGIELREGSIERNFQDAPVKTYTRDKIATIAQCGSRLRKRTPKTLHNKITLERQRLVDLVKKGV